MKSWLRLSAAVSALMLAGAAAPAFAQHQGHGPHHTGQHADPGVTAPALGFERRVLANGLEVYTARDTSTSNVTVQVWYRVGSKDDPAGRSGFAHLFEHLMFKATENFPNETFDRLTEDVGGNNNAFTADDVTAYHETIPANHLQRLLFAEAERMGSLVVNEEVFQSERDVVKEEYRQRILASPYGRLVGLFMPSTIYREHPYRRPGIGSITDLDAATLEDVRRFHATYYRPDNAVLIVAGNFEQGQLDQWVDTYFSPLTNPSRPIPANAVVEPEPAGPREATFYAPNVPLPAAVMSWPAVAYGHADRAALTVLDGIMSTGESSRLYRSLVYDQQIAAQASGIADFAQQAGVQSFLAIMADGHSADEGLAAIRAEVARLRDEPVSAAELAEAKNELIADALRNRETIEDRANVLGNALIMTRDAGTADREIAEIQAVTAADIQRVARQYLSDNRAISIRYMRADADHPATEQATNVDAPVRVADLAPVGQIFALKPEAERTPMPSVGPAVDLTTPVVADFELANGLRVLVAERDGLPLVSARLSFEAGSADDPAGKAGVSSMTATLLTQGAAGRAAPVIASEIEALGANVGASSGPDFTTLYGNSPANVFPQTLQLMADLARRPDFPAEELERQRGQAIDNLRVALSSPGSIAGMATGRVIYGGAAYGSPGGGTLTSLEGLTRDDIATFHAAHYGPSDATLVFSGDIDEATARTLAQQMFGDWHDSARSAAVTTPTDRAGPPMPARIIVIDQPGAGQAAVYAAIRSVPRDTPDYFPLSLGNTLLGGSFTSRLNQEIRIEKGLSYGVRSSLGLRQDDGAFVASAQTRNDAVVEVTGLVMGNIARMSAEAPSAHEMTTRQAIMAGGFGSSLETVDGLGSQVANLALYDLPISELARYVGNVEAVTADQVRDAFARRLPIREASIVVVGDAAQFIDAFRAQYPTVEVISLEDLNLDSATLR